MVEGPSFFTKPAPFCLNDAASCPSQQRTVGIGSETGGSLEMKPETGGRTKAGSAAGSGGASGEAFGRQDTSLCEAKASVFTEVQAKEIFSRSI